MQVQGVIDRLFSTWCLFCGDGCAYYLRWDEIDRALVDKGFDFDLLSPSEISGLRAVGIYNAEISVPPSALGKVVGCIQPGSLVLKL